VNRRPGNVSLGFAARPFANQKIVNKTPRILCGGGKMVTTSRKRDSLTPGV
jgi:hypothetical protein